MHDHCHASYLRKVGITRSRNGTLCTRGKSLPTHWMSRLPAQSDAAAAATEHQRTIHPSSKPAGPCSVICFIAETARHETFWQAPFQPTLHNCCNCFIDRLGVYSGRAVGGWKLKPRSLHTGLAGVLTAGERGTHDTCRSNRESHHSRGHSAQISKQSVYRRGDRGDQ
jgi:hypothetical protein